MLRCSFLTIFLCSSLFVMAQDWHVVRENGQKAFPMTVPAGNYSGITHLQDDVYAVVSDKSDSALYFNFRIQVNPQTGDLEHVENLGFTEYVDGAPHKIGKVWMGKEKGFDHEAITKVSDSTLVIASEGFYRLKEYPILPLAEGSKMEKNTSFRQKLWEEVFSSSSFFHNYVFESLAYDSIHHILWTIPESTLREDGVPATSENGLENRLRLMAIDWRGKNHEKKEDEKSQHTIQEYAYLMDKPSTTRKAETYVMGVSELCVLPDGQLLVLEREAFIPKIKLGAFCKCKLYLINPLKENHISSESLENVTFMQKRLLTEWRTGLSLFDRSFANYEGMCLGPQLEDGSQVLILLSDSQDQYAGVLKDWFKTIVLAK